MKRKYEIFEGAPEMHYKKLKDESTTCENVANPCAEVFPRIYWSEIIHCGMGSKKLLEKVYNIYMSEINLMTQFMNIYSNQECTPEIMCKLFSLILEIEKSNTLKILEIEKE
jgi:hypothetical protein